MLVPRGSRPRKEAPVDASRPWVNHVKLAELTREKDETDQLLDEKMERFIELQDLVESLQKM